MTTRRLLATAVALAATAAGAAEEPYPNRVVRLLCWTSAGAPLDVMMRQVGKQFGAIFNQTFVVDNRAGANGVVAMGAITSQPADGYNILSTTSSMSFTMASSKIPFAVSDFTVLPALQAEPSAVAVRRDSRFKTLTELVEYLRENPDKLSVGGFSSGGFHQFVFYRLQQVGRSRRPGFPSRAARRPAWRCSADTSTSRC